MAHKLQYILEHTQLCLMSKRYFIFFMLIGLFKYVGVRKSFLKTNLKSRHVKRLRRTKLHVIRLILNVKLCKDWMNDIRKTVKVRLKVAARNKIPQMRCIIVVRTFLKLSVARYWLITATAIMIWYCSIMRSLKNSYISLKNYRIRRHLLYTKNENYSQETAETNTHTYIKQDIQNTV